MPQLLRLLDRPIAFHRCFVDLAGSITAALMLSQAIYWQQRTRDPDGWWFKTRDEWQEETGLGRREQETARRKLRKLGVLREDLRGVPAQLWYMVDEIRLFELLAGASEKGAPVGTNPPNWKGGTRPTGRAESAQQAGTKAPSKKAPFVPTFKGTETTTETTTEITTTTPNPSASNEATATTDSARGGGVEGSNAETQDGGQKPAVTEATIEKKTASSKKEIENAAATAKDGRTSAGNRNSANEREPPDERRPELAFPAKLTESEYADIAAQVNLLSPVIAQQMLDVIDAKIKAGQIKTSPASVLRGIIRKHKADPGSFDPSMGFAVADARRRRATAEVQARAHAQRREHEREASRITPAAREIAHRSIAHIKELLHGHA
ncbi:MAG: hypothetical protein WAV81_16635 [Candidatus Competibacter sp.]